MRVHVSRRQRGTGLRSPRWDEEARSHYHAGGVRRSLTCSLTACCIMGSTPSGRVRRELQSGSRHPAARRRVAPSHVRHPQSQSRSKLRPTPTPLRRLIHVRAVVQLEMQLPYCNVNMEMQHCNAIIVTQTTHLYAYLRYQPISLSA